MGECEVGENDRPVETIKILSCEVLWNPFDKGAVNRAERKGTKDKKLLSFGEDETENELEAFGGGGNGKMRSLHDSKLKDKTLSSKVPDTIPQSEVKVTDSSSKRTAYSAVYKRDY
eukprot:gene30871-41076_t